jgi:hypothetical protein
MPRNIAFEWHPRNLHHTKMNHILVFSERKAARIGNAAVVADLQQLQLQKHCAGCPRLPSDINIFV